MKATHSGNDGTDRLEMETNNRKEWMVSVVVDDFRSWSMDVDQQRKREGEVKGGGKVGAREFSFARCT